MQYMNTIKHIRAWAASLIAAPFVLIVFVISMAGLILYVVAMLICKVPQYIYKYIGPMILRRDELHQYHNPVSRISQRLVDMSNWPNL